MTCETANIATPLRPAGDSGARPEVTVIVPCFNESEGIEHTFAQLLLAQQTCAGRYDLRFLFVDDASTDDTVPRIEETIRGWSGFELVKHTVNQGITGAIMTGLSAARTELVASLDADCTYDPQRLPDLLELMLADEAQPLAMVTASPYHPRGAVENVPRWRLWISGACSGMYRWVLRTSLYTYTSCFRIYRRTALVGWMPRNTGFVGLVEMIRTLEERGERIGECPAVLKVRQFGQSKMRIARVIKQHLKFMAQTVWRRLTNQRDLPRVAACNLNQTHC